MIARVFINSTDELRSALEADERRDVYECQGGGYAVSYQGGEVPAAFIAAAVKSGMLRPKYEDETRFACWRLSSSTALPQSA